MYKRQAMNFLVEAWGGKYQSQDISAKKGIGVPELMEKVLDVYKRQGLVLTATAQTTIAPAIPRDEKIEQKIETLLKKMTLRCV